MRETQFDYLMALHRHEETMTFDAATVESCLTQGWVENAAVSAKGYEALQPYKVENAIILAAGPSRRCLPLSRYLPKGLFEIHGETMVERQIKQLLAAGVQQIVLVVGYLKDKYYEQLSGKYKELIIVDNEEWSEKNNIASIYAARKYFKNSYLCCSDNWFAHNVYRDYVYDSYYACKYTDEFQDEYCVLAYDENGYMANVKKGGEKAWYTIGEAYFTREFSEKFINFLIKEYYDPEVKYMLWDDFHIRHIADLKLRVKQYSDQECKEFDTIEDITQFYPGFAIFIEQFLQEEELKNSSQRISYLSNYADVKQYSVVATETLTGRLHVNENLFGPSPKCLETIKNSSWQDLAFYDLTREDDLAVAIAKKLEISTDNIFIHSGSSDVIKTIMTIVLNRGDSVLLPTPAWNYYKSVVELRLAKAEYYHVVSGEKTYEFDVNDLITKARTLAPRIIVITTPHNPTGAVISPEALERVIKENPSSLVIVDEAYMGFSNVNYDFKYLLNTYQNTIFTRTFSKFYGLAGLRVGYGLCAPMAKHVFKLDLNPFRVCQIARRACIAALEDNDYYTSLKQKIMQIRDWFITSVNQLPGVKAFDSASNFVFLHLDGVDIQTLKDYLAANGYLVRLWTEGRQLAMRVTLAPQEQMQALVQLMSSYLQR